MNKSFTPTHSIQLTNQFHSRLQSDIGRAFRDVYKKAKPGKQALRNVLGYASALEVIPTISGGSQEVIIN
jgi:hypothetical protein